MVLLCFALHCVCFPAKPAIVTRDPLLLHESRIVVPSSSHHTYCTHCIDPTEPSHPSRTARQTNPPFRPAAPPHDGLLLLHKHGLLLLNATHGISAGAGTHFLEPILSLVINAGTMHVLLELDDLRVDGLELGLVHVVAGGVGGAVGAAAGLVGVVGVVLQLGVALLAPGMMC